MLRQAKISTAWKLVVYTVVVRSRVLYTLETLELTPAQQCMSWPKANAHTKGPLSLIELGHTDADSAQPTH